MPGRSPGMVRAFAVCELADDLAVKRVASRRPRGRDPNPAACRRRTGASTLQLSWTGM